MREAQSRHSIILSQIDRAYPLEDSLKVSPLCEWHKLLHFNYCSSSRMRVSEMPMRGRSSKIFTVMASNVSHRYDSGVSGATSAIAKASRAVVRYRKALPASIAPVDNTVSCSSPTLRYHMDGSRN